MHATLPLLNDSDFPRLRRGRLETVQVNLGYRCNQACLHCHVGAGPTRREQMDRGTVDQVLDYVRSSGAQNLDITGGAPELNPNFRHLVQAARRLGLRVIDRCNLTVLNEPAQAGLAEFLASEGVEIVASLPCYLERNVDAQRGAGVFQASIDALVRLNAVGYARPGTGLVLNLVHNPGGPQLPPPQAALEADYKRELKRRYGIVFDRLYALANLPIQRFGSTLVSKGGFDAYLALLRSAHCSENLGSVMCRSLISVDWRGHVYDCDFNQMLGLPFAAHDRPRPHIRDLKGTVLEGLPIAVADHCYGCTAGQGSSCGGALG
jgi:radical SAM/Cys-rich protein